MSSPTQLPAYLRYLRARLQPFSRPAFWGLTLGIFLVPLFVWEYWVKPFSGLESNPLSQFDTPEPEPTLSGNGLISPTDIDNSQVLKNELTLSSPGEETPQTIKPKNALAPFTTNSSAQTFKEAANLLAPSNSSEEKATSNNPFAKSVQDFLHLNTVNSLTVGSDQQPTQTNASTSEPTTAPSGFGLNLSNLLNPTISPESSSPLENALNRITQTSPSNGSNSVQTSPYTQSQTVGNSASGTPGLNPSTTVPNPTYYNPYNRVDVRNYAPSTTPAGSGYNAAGQPNYPSSTLPSGSGYNGAGQPMYAPVTVPTASGYNASGYANYPVAPTVPGNTGQYSIPSAGNNGFANPGVNPTPVNPGLQPSQLSGSGLNR